MEFEFGKMKEVLDWGGGDSCRAVSVPVMPQKCTVKTVNFISHVFYQFKNKRDDLRKGCWTLSAGALWRELGHSRG